MQLAIGWYRLQDDHVTGSRADIADIAEACEMPRVRPHNTSVQAFKQAAYTPAVILGPDGEQIRTRSVEMLGGAAGVKTIELQAEGKPPRRLAQVKHFSARRTVRGAVKSSERVMSRVSARLEPGIDAQVRAWVAAFEDACGNGQVGPSMVRGYVGREWDEFAIGVPDRRGTYYLYVSDAPRVRRIDAFVKAIAPGSYAMALPLALDCPREPIIEAVEMHYTSLFALMENGNVSAGTQRNRRSLWKRLAAQLDAHEENLGSALPRAHAAAASARHLISPAQPTSRLPRVDLQ